VSITIHEKFFLLSVSLNFEKVLDFGFSKYFLKKNDFNKGGGFAKISQIGRGFAKISQIGRGFAKISQIWRGFAIIYHLSLKSQKISGIFIKNYLLSSSFPFTQ